MKHIFYPLMGFLIVSCSHDNHTDVLDSDHAEESGEISLCPSVAEKFGVEVAEITPGDFASSLSVNGQIVDSPNSSAVVVAPTSGIVSFAKGLTDGSSVSQGELIASVSAKNISGGDANVQALAALETAKAELERLEPLYASRLITAKEYADAQQAYRQAKAAYSQNAASGRISAPISGVVTGILAQEGQYVEAGSPIASISSLSKLTLRADLPQRYRGMLNEITGANIVNPTTQEVVSLSELGGKRISLSQAASSQRGYVPVYFTFNNNGEFVPGEYVTVYLLNKVVPNVISVQLSAISEQQGAYFVYKQLDEECYEKVPVKLGGNDGKYVEILSGLAAGDTIVTNNVVAVRLAEGARVAPEGHTH